MLDFNLDPDFDLEAVHPLSPDFTKIPVSLYNGPALWQMILDKAPEGAIIAGGAIRDYFLGYQPKDIDIFLPSDAWQMPVGFHSITDSDERAEEYEAVPNIDIVAKGEIAGYLVDYIGINPNDISRGRQLVQGFDFGISRCWFDGSLHDTPEAYMDRVNFTVTLLLGDRYERSLARFDRFNVRMGGRYTLKEAFQ